MKPIARLVIRDGGNDDGLIIGCRIDNPKSLKPGFVYEIHEILDEIMIREVGKSMVEAIDFSRKSDPSYHYNWGLSINDLLERAGKYLFLTKKEYQSECKNDTL